jgi:uncharacterized repeat protein (TIGR02543 family)
LTNSAFFFTIFMLKTLIFIIITMVNKKTPAGELKWSKNFLIIFIAILIIIWVFAFIPGTVKNRSLSSQAVSVPPTTEVPETSPDWIVDFDDLVNDYECKNFRRGPDVTVSTSPGTKYVCGELLYPANSVTNSKVFSTVLDGEVEVFRTLRTEDNYVHGEIVRQSVSIYRNLLPVLNNKTDDEIKTFFEASWVCVEITPYEIILRGYAQNFSVEKFSRVLEENFECKTAALTQVWSSSCFRENYTVASPIVSITHLIDEINSADGKLTGNILFESPKISNAPCSQIWLELAVNGACGTSNNVCFAGTSVDVTDSEVQYLWSCNGTNGGTNISCALDKPINGKCGTASGKTYALASTSYGIDTQCENGIASSTVFPAAATSVTWTCSGQNGGIASSACTASRTAATPVNGLCGATNNTCISGTLLDYPDEAANYVWSCEGLHGGVHESCFLLKPTYTFTAVKSGTGAWNITATGINCGTDCSEKYTLGSTTVLTAVALPGSTFTGWTGTCTGTGTCTVTMSSDKTVTATFTLIPVVAHTVTFDSQKATTVATPGTKSVLTPAKTVDTLPSNPVRTGYTFGGWFTGANWTGTQFTVTTAVSGNITVYAKWIPNTYSVTYNANKATGGTVPATQKKIYGVNLILTNNAGKLVRTGYTFVGWNTAANGTGIDYPIASLYKANANVVLYAKWIPQ